MIKSLANMKYIPQEIMDHISEKELFMVLLNADMDVLQDESRAGEWENGHAGKVVMSRYLTYVVLAQETGVEVPDAIAAIVRQAGYDKSEKAYLVALTCKRTEKMACLELYKRYQQDTSKKHLAVYARDALETAFDL